MVIALHVYRLLNLRITISFCGDTEPSKINKNKKMGRSKNSYYAYMLGRFVVTNEEHITTVSESLHTLSCDNSFPFMFNSIFKSASVWGSML